MFSIYEVEKACENQGFTLKQSHSLGGTFYLEVSYDAEKVKKELQFCKDNRDYFVNNYIKPSNTNIAEDVMRLLRKSKFHNRLIVSGDRRSGKSTYVIIDSIVESVLYNKNVIVVGMTSNEALRLYKQTLELLEILPPFLFTITNKSNKITFKEGGSILYTTPKANQLCGIRPDVVYLDEFDFVGEKDQVEFYTSIWPIISIDPLNTKIRILSTIDQSKEGIFYTLIKDSYDGYNDFVVDHLKQIY
jgi:hypothetical protein